MYTITATEKGQIVIPVEIRKKMKIKKGTKIHVDLQGGTITLRPETTEYLQSLVGIFGKGGNVTDFLLEERAAEKRESEKRFKKWEK
ncbi:MAG: AbrB family transcriptional regulator [Candidatus Goldiibacteriota bacterium HGW-Goldbacteria-1]|jgi:AbrB family looped-hinge helix DNA binding protein|nr:MAG: AbrB family transcriptional regulator [Candidatus Goldiibacteriota bacterium HGW-Goldbacteria-1]